MSHPCPVLNLPQDEQEIRERKEAYGKLWPSGELSMEEMDIKYAWFDAVHTVIENKNGIKPESTTE